MLKKKIVVLLFSMLVFVGIFLYSAFQYVDSPSKSDEKEEQTEIEDDIYENAWIQSAENKDITFYYDGLLRTVKASVAVGETITEAVGDVTIKDGKVVKIKIKPTTVTGTVISASDTSIGLESDDTTDTYKLSDNFQSYQVNDAVEMVASPKQLIGYSKVKLYVEDDKICAAVVTGPIEVEDIRVLLGTTEYKAVVHSKITVTCKSAFTIESNGKTKSYKAGKKVTIKATDSRLEKDTIVIKPKKESAKIQILTIKRNGTCPSYRGEIELAKYDSKMTVINELPLEEYLYAVIPSEMPTSYDIEALKVQAVCARTYAYNQMNAGNFSEYGAHIDDSVQSQVYNNIAEDKNSIAAVKATYGEILMYNDSAIQTYYFSTSWGCTADAADVWIDSTSDILKGSIQLTKESEKVENTDFSVEKNFKAFLNNDDASTYDSEFPWYRWSVTITAAKLQKTLEKNIESRYEVNPSLILTKQDDGSYKSEKISTIGTIKSIKVGNRCSSGLINEIIIVGSEKTIKIKSEYNIRCLLAPESSTIKRQDKSKVEGLSLLPSAFFLVTKTDDGDFKFQGGGYGHGVGMSQNGAKAMADSGFTYTTILKHFYDGTDIFNLYL